ncbi:hypothetical protein M1O47_03555 [Dehalococcoidia bacterium]|nr:hypothetical protein [Dehalococcoidia bacterium]
MSYEFTDDEIKEIITAARIFSQDFNEERFQALRKLEKRLADSSFLETVRGLVRMEEEMDVPINEVLDAFEKLLSDRDRVSAEVAGLRGKLVELQGRTQEAETRHRQQQAVIEQTRRELQAIQIRRQEEEKKLAAFEKKAEREKARIDKEVEEYRQKANVTEQEVVLAGQVKAQAEGHGFSLELALDLAHEFAGYENAREELARALEKSQTLPGHIDALASELKKLESERWQKELEISGLKATRFTLVNLLSCQKFYQRYQSASRLMDSLASWSGLYFLRCNNPVYAFAGAFDKKNKCARFFVEKWPQNRCPCCGYPGAVFDSELYQLLNWPVGISYELKLGEDK